MSANTNQQPIATENQADDASRNIPELRINVRQVVDELDSPDDEGVEGIYVVVFNDNVGPQSMQKHASIALDIFHARQAIACLDDFEIDVIDDAGMTVEQDDLHEDYSASDDGYVCKEHDTPIDARKEPRYRYEIGFSRGASISGMAYVENGKVVLPDEAEAEIARRWNTPITGAVIYVCDQKLMLINNQDGWFIGEDLGVEESSEAKNQMTHEILLNGQQLVKGDQGSVTVIFNNLSGENYINPPSWKTETHQEYVLAMEHHFGVSFADGFIELAEIGKSPLRAHRMVPTVQAT